MPEGSIHIMSPRNHAAERRKAHTFVSSWSPAVFTGNDCEWMAFHPENDPDP